MGFCNFDAAARGDIPYNLLVVWVFEFGDVIFLYKICVGALIFDEP